MTDDLNKPIDDQNDPEQWLDKYLFRNGITYDYKTEGVKQDGIVIDPRVVLAKLRIATSKSGNNNIRNQLNDAMILWKYRCAKIAVSEIRQVLSYTASETSLIDVWVRAVTGTESLLDSAVVRHFIWQIKRKLFGLPIEHHMMPILYGKSGAGKSVAVLKLLEPLTTVALSTNMSIFQDRFGMRQFTRNYAMFFDELEGAGSIDVNRLKQVITSPVMEWRVMHSEGVASAPQNCTFIGCTNDPVAERIKDPTSARRFWQINCADKIDWEVINKLDFLALWKSVNEDAACPIAPHINEIRSIQDQNIRTKDLVEQWLEDKCEPQPFYNESPTTKVLFDYFKAWCEWQNITIFPSLQSFSRSLPMKIKMLGWNVESKHSNNGTIWAIKTK